MKFSTVIQLCQPFNASMAFTFCPQSRNQNFDFALTLRSTSASIIWPHLTLLVKLPIVSHTRTHT